MVYQHTCVHERETQKEKSEKWGSGKCMVFAHAAGVQKGRPIRLTGSRCELHFSFSSAPATATIITNKTNHVLLLICRNKDCISRIFFIFFHEAGCRLSSALCTQDTGTISTFECEPVRSACAVATRARRCRLLATREAAAESARAAAEASGLESSLQGEKP